MRGRIVDCDLVLAVKSGLVNFFECFFSPKLHRSQSSLQYTLTLRSLHIYSKGLDRYQLIPVQLLPVGQESILNLSLTHTHTHTHTHKHTPASTLNTLTLYPRRQAPQFWPPPTTSSHAILIRSVFLLEPHGIGRRNLGEIASVRRVCVRVLVCVSDMPIQNYFLTPCMCVCVCVCVCVCTGGGKVYSTAEVGRYYSSEPDAAECRRATCLPSCRTSFTPPKTAVRYYTNHSRLHRRQTRHASPRLRPRP